MNASTLAGILLILLVLPGCLSSMVFKSARGTSPAKSVEARKAGKQFEDPAPIGYAILPLTAVVDVALLPYYAIMYGVMKADGEEF